MKRRSSVPATYPKVDKTQVYYGSTKSPTQTGSGTSNPSNPNISIAMSDHPASAYPQPPSSASSTIPNQSDNQLHHLCHLRAALDLACLSPPKPTNFRVGAILISNPSAPHQKPETLSTGYTLELPGNTHAEENALGKLASTHSIPDSQLHSILTPDLNAVLYTTLEPCGRRLSGNKSCVQRIIDTRQMPGSGIRRVVFGAREPGTFVVDSGGLKRLEEEGVEWECVPGLEEEILTVARQGHIGGTATGKEKGTDVDNISAEERKRQEAVPRNRKKRMMEVDVHSAGNQ